MAQKNYQIFYSKSKLSDFIAIINTLYFSFVNCSKHLKRVGSTFS